MLLSERPAGQRYGSPGQDSDARRGHRLARHGQQTVAHVQSVEEKLAARHPGAGPVPEDVHVHRRGVHDGLRAGARDVLPGALAGQLQWRGDRERHVCGGRIRTGVDVHHESFGEVQTVLGLGPRRVF